MGIRIKKVLGYAIKNVSYSKKHWHFTDERINPDGYLGKNVNYEGQKKWSEERFLQYAKACLDGFDYHWLEADYKEHTFDFDDFIYHDMEYGIAGVIMFQPPISGLRWYRGDDSIDYYEHSLTYNGIENSIQFLDRPIYPFEGYIDSRTGKRYTGKEGQLVHDMWYSIRSRKGTKGKVLKNYNTWISACVKKLKFKSLVEAKRITAPVIPEVLVEMIKYLQIFSDDSTIWQLRPAVYIYWS